MNTLWTPEVKIIEQALGGRILLVGGCVRDYLLGKKPEDIDITTPIPPKEVLKKLEQVGIKTRIITLRLGCILAKINGLEFEIMTLRQDIYQNGKLTVRFIQDYRQDALRRDFTINALYMDKNGQILDPCGGQEDLNNRIVRFIGNPQKRLAEDPLRGLRYLRFWSQYGKTKPDKEILPLLPYLQNTLKDVSVARRKKEVIKLLKSHRFSDIVKIIKKTKLVSAILEGIGDKMLEEAFKGEKNE